LLGRALKNKLDLEWWYTFLPCYNGISIKSLENWSAFDEILSCDACFDGFADILH
jgi:hypothetical protein